MNMKTWILIALAILAIFVVAVTASLFMTPQMSTILQYGPTTGP